MAISDAELGFTLSVCAGLATGIGGAVQYSEKLVRLSSPQTLASGLAFAAGMMVYVSFFDIVPKAQEAFESPFGPNDAYLATTLCFFAGVGIMFALDALVHRLGPKHASGHSLRPDVCCALEDIVVAESATHDVDVEDASEEKKETTEADIAKRARQTKRSTELSRMGLKTALAIAFHNFPEGLATFVATLSAPGVGVALAVAIAIHNIPEGLCIALPIYYATGSRSTALKWSLWAGITEPIGAAVGWIILANVINNIVFGILFGIVAGMMCIISIRELIPTANHYDPHDTRVSQSFATGMIVMATSLILFTYS